MRKQVPLILILFALLAMPGRSQQTAAPDPWERLRFFAGHWKGTSEGEPGRGNVERTYQFVMNGRYLHERNVSIYAPQEKNPKGERHEHWSFFSHDRMRGMLVLRQFHVEGFVNQYAMPVGGATKDGFTFESEAFENLPAGWKARERYKIISKDEFTETFELAPPGKPFEVYSRAHFRRVK